MELLSATLAPSSLPAAAPGAGAEQPSPAAAEAPQSAAEIREELMLTEIGLRLTGLAFIGWAALLAAGRLRGFDLQVASFEQGPWTFLGGLAAQFALPLTVGIELCFLRPSGRFGGNVLALFWTFSVWLGPLGAIYLLRAVNNESARRVLSAEYQDVRRATAGEELNVWLWLLVTGMIAVIGSLYVLDFNRYLAP